MNATSEDLNMLLTGEFSNRGVSATTEREDQQEQVSQIIPELPSPKFQLILQEKC